MNKELLLKLADVLDKVPGHMWDFSTWVDGPGDLADPACGTTACALGWATTIPECGLVLDAGYGVVREREVPWSSGLQAARTAFDLTDAEARQIFYSADPEYKGDICDYTAANAAAYIRKVVANES